MVGVVSSSAEESLSSMGAAALRFRESGVLVIASGRTFFWLVGGVVVVVVVDAFFRSLLPMDFDTRAKELIFDNGCDCWGAAAALDLPPAAAPCAFRIFFTAGAVGMVMYDGCLRHR